VTGLGGRAGIAGGALVIAAFGGFAIPAATTTPSAAVGAKLALQACGPATASLANTWHIE
jgi:hypothetical protein